MYLTITDKYGTKANRKQAQYILTKTNERNKKQVQCINQTMSNHGN